MWKAESYRALMYECAWIARRGILAGLMFFAMVAPPARGDGVGSGKLRTLPMPTADHWAAVVVNGERVDANVVCASCQPGIEDESTAQLSEDERRQRVLGTYGNHWQDAIEQRLILQHIASTNWQPETVARWRSMGHEVFTRHLVSHGIAGPVDQLPESLVRLRRKYQDYLVTASFLAYRVFGQGKGVVINDPLRNPYREVLSGNPELRTFLFDLRRKARIEVIGEDPVIEWDSEEPGSLVRLGFDCSEW